MMVARFFVDFFSYATCFVTLIVLLCALDKCWGFTGFVALRVF